MFLQKPLSFIGHSKAEREGWFPLGVFKEPTIELGRQDSDSLKGKGHKSCQDCDPTGQLNQSCPTTLEN